MAILCSTSIRCGSSLEEALKAIRQLEFEGIDLLAIDGWVHVNTRDLVENFDNMIKYLDSMFGKYEIKPIALNCGIGAQLHHRNTEVNLQRIKEIEALIRLMRYFDVKIAAIQPRNSDMERPWEDVLGDCVETLREQKAMGDAAGVTFALEFHVNSPFETMSQIYRILEKMPEMPVVYDPSHFVMQGLDIRETGWLLQNAVHVHLRDAAPGKLQSHFGAGRVDFDWILGELKASDYRGHFSIEYLETEDMDILDDVCKLREYITGNFMV